MKKATLAHNKTMRIDEPFIIVRTNYKANGTYATDSGALPYTSSNERRLYLVKDQLLITSSYVPMHMNVDADLHPSVFFDPQDVANVYEEECTFFYLQMIRS